MTSIQKPLWEQFVNIPKQAEESQWFFSKIWSKVGNKLYDFIKRGWEKSRNNRLTDSFANDFNQWVMEIEWEKLKSIINPNLDTTRYTPTNLKTLQNIFSDNTITKEEWEVINRLPSQYRDLVVQSKNLQWLQDVIYWWDFAVLAPEQQSEMIKNFEDTYKTYQKHRDYLMTDDKNKLRAIDNWLTVKDTAYKAYSNKLTNIVNQNNQNRDLVSWLRKSFDTYFDWYYDKYIEIKASNINWDTELNKLLIDYRNATNDVLQTLLKEWEEYNKKDNISWSSFYRDVLAKKPEVYDKFIELDRKNRKLSIRMMQKSWFGTDKETSALWEVWQFMEAWRQTVLSPFRETFERWTEATWLNSMTSLSKIQYLSDQIWWTMRFLGNTKNFIGRNAFDIWTLVWEMALTSWWWAVEWAIEWLSKVKKIGSLVSKINKIDKLIEANKFVKLWAKFSSEALQWVRIDSMFNYHFSPWISADTVMQDMVWSLVFDWASALLHTIKWTKLAVSWKEFREYIKMFDSPDWTNKLAMTLWYDAKNTAELLKGNAKSLPIALKKQHELLTSTVVDLSTKLKNIGSLSSDMSKNELKEIRKDMGLLFETINKYVDESSIVRAWPLEKIRKLIIHWDTKQLSKISWALNDVVASAMVKTQSKMTDAANVIAKQYIETDMVDSWLIKRVANNQKIYSDWIVEWLLRFAWDTTVDYWNAMKIAERVKETNQISDKDIINMITSVGAKKWESAKDYTTRLARFFSDMVGVEPKELTNLWTYANKLDEVVSDIGNTMKKSGITIKFNKNKNAQFNPKQMAAVMTTLSSAYGDNVDDFVMALMHEFSHWLTTFINDAMLVEHNGKMVWLRTLIEKSYKKELKSLNKLFSAVLPEQVRKDFNIQNIKEVTQALKNDKVMSLHPEETRFILDAMDRFNTRYTNIEEYIAYNLSEQLLWKQSKLPFNEKLGKYFVELANDSDVMKETLATAEERLMVFNNAAMKLENVKWSNFDATPLLKETYNYSHWIGSERVVLKDINSFIDEVIKWRSFTNIIGGIKDFDYDQLKQLVSWDKEMNIMLNRLEWLKIFNNNDDFLKRIMAHSFWTGLKWEDALLAGTLFEIFGDMWKTLTPKWLNNVEKVQRITEVQTILNQFLIGRDDEVITNLLGSLEAQKIVLNPEYTATKKNLKWLNTAKKELWINTNSYTMSDIRKAVLSYTQDTRKYFSPDSMATIFRAYNSKVRTNSNLMGIAIFKNAMASLNLDVGMATKNMKQVVEDLVERVMKFKDNRKVNQVSVLANLFSSKKALKFADWDMDNIIESIKKLWLKKAMGNVKMSGKFKFNQNFDIWPWVFDAYVRFTARSRWWPKTKAYNELMDVLYSLYEPKYARDMWEAIATNKTMLKSNSSKFNSYTKEYKKWLDFKQWLNASEILKKDLWELSFMAKDDYSDITWGYRFNTKIWEKKMVNGNLTSMDSTAQDIMKWLDVKWEWRWEQISKLDDEISKIATDAEFKKIQKALSKCK